MNLQQKVDAMSEGLHADLDTIDGVIAGASARLVLATEIRRESGMRGMEGQRTLKRMAAQLTDLIELRGRHVVLHESVQKDAEKADIVWDCPDARAEADNVTSIKTAA